MKFKTLSRWGAVLLAAGFAFLVFSPLVDALTAGIRWGRDDANRNFTKRVWIDNQLDVDGAVNLNSTVNGNTAIRVLNYEFYDVDVAASQTAVEWGTDASATVGGASFKRIAAPVAGSVIGVTVFSNAACTSGTLTADVTIAGTATGLQAVLNSTTATTFAVGTQAIDTDTFTAGQAIGVKVTTNSVFAPTTADVVVSVIVEY